MNIRIHRVRSNALTRSLLALVLASGVGTLAGCSSDSDADTATGTNADDTILADDVDGSDDAAADDVATADDETAADDSLPGEADDAGADGSDIVLAPGYDPDNLPGGGSITLEEDDEGNVVILCGDTPCVCSDGIDNDDDGLIDGADSECTGPFDNDEETFSTGIPGDNRDPFWQDCFFDGNSGGGDDGCRYHTDCITGDADPDTDKRCSVSEQCVEFCQPLVPPGCDCFGCCEVNVDGNTLHILVGEQCSIANIEDESKCPRCTQTTACINECGECELCVGKTLEDLPDSCSKDPPADPSDPDPTDPDPPTDPDEPAPPPNVCDNGATACTTNADCSTTGNAYCSFGCCKLLINMR